MMRRLHLTCLCVLLLSVGLGAQVPPRVEANAALPDNSIRIGEQVKLRLALRYREGAKKAVVKWPTLADTLASGVEIISLDTLQTDLRDRAAVLYEQWRFVTITAFEKGTYTIPPISFVIDGQTVSTQPLLLYVETVAVDTTQDIKDIKNILDVPPAPKRKEADDVLIWWWVIIGVTVLALVAVGLWLLLRKKKTDTIAPVLQHGGIEPHERVLEALAELGRQQLWAQPGQLKTYHTRLTEILRAWVVERYRISALEMTTAEIVQHLRYKQTDENAALLLRDVLRMADTVKFAKNIPSGEDNERSLHTAMEFVRKTPFPMQQPAIHSPTPQQR